MNENERKVVVRRMLLLIAVACIIMGLYTFRLIFLQLVNGDSFKAKAIWVTFCAISERTFPLVTASEASSNFPVFFTDSITVS